MQSKDFSLHFSTFIKMDILKKVTKNSLYVLVPVLIGSVFIESQKLPLGIFMGWFFGIFNFKGMTKNVEAMTDIQKAKTKMFMLSIFRLGILFAAIFALAYFKIINIIGLLVGFTIVFVFIIIEGLKAAKAE